MYTRRCITNVKATGFIAVAIQISQIYNERWVGWVLSESFLIKVAMIGFLSHHFFDRLIDQWKGAYFSLANATNG